MNDLTFFAEWSTPLATTCCWILSSIDVKSGFYICLLRLVGDAAERDNINTLAWLTFIFSRTTFWFSEFAKKARKEWIRPNGEKCTGIPLRN